MTFRLAGAAGWPLPLPEGPLRPAWLHVVPVPYAEARALILAYEYLAR